MFSAYDIKKILPRAVFALIGASLSWSLMLIIIGAVNTLGDSTYTLIKAPFEAAGVTGLEIDALSGGSFIALAGVAASGAILGLLPVAGVAVAGITGVFLAFAIVLIRRVVLTAMVLIAPLAIVAGIFPGTESLFKKWWDWFFKLLLMYPFIMGMFAITEVVAGLLTKINGAGSSSTGFTGTVYDLAAIALLILPYFLIGKALSFAGGTIAKVAGFVNNRDKGLIDRSKKWDQTRVSRNRSDAKGGSRYQDQFGTRTLNRSLRRITNPGSLNPLASSSKRRASLDAGAAAAIANLEELHPESKTLTGEEAEILARAQGSRAESRRAVAAKAERARNDAITELLQRNPFANTDEQNRVGDRASAEASRLWQDRLASAERKVGGLDLASSAYAFSKATEAGAFALDLAHPETAQEIERIGQSLGQGIGGTGRAGVDFGRQLATSGLKGAGERGNLVTSHLGEGRTVQQAVARALERSNLEQLGKQSESSAQQMATVLAQQIQDEQIAMQTQIAAGNNAEAQQHLDNIVASLAHVETVRVAAGKHGTQQTQNAINTARQVANGALTQAQTDAAAAGLAIAGGAASIEDAARDASRLRTGQP